MYIYIYTHVSSHPEVDRICVCFSNIFPFLWGLFFHFHVLNRVQDDCIYIYIYIHITYYGRGLNYL